MKSRFRFFGGVVLLLLCGALSTGFAAEYSASLKKTIANYEKVMAKSKEDLLQGFDRAAKAVTKRKINALEKTHLVEVIEAEKARFEKSGEPPWSAPMRAEFTKYMKATSQAQTSLKRAIEAEVSKLLKSGESDSAKELSSSFELLVSPQPVGTWVASATGYPDVTITMYSNGTFTDRDGKPNCEWAYDNNGVLLMKWPSSFGGFTTSKVQVADDGLSYRGENEKGVLNTGRYVPHP